LGRTVSIEHVAQSLLQTSLIVFQREIQGVALLP
jgi:hypothetical protein